MVFYFEICYNLKGILEEDREMYDNRSNNNDLLMLGIMFLVIGGALGVYSISSYLELKNLGDKIDFELIDDNNQMSSTDKYYKYLSFADFLNQKLNQNKNIPIKNASCVYLDYAQHNAIELYRLTSRRMELDESKRSVAAGNVRGLVTMLDNYKTCNKTQSYKTELNNILDEIQKSENLPTDSNIRINRTIDGYSSREVQTIPSETQPQAMQDTQNIQTNVQSQAIDSEEPIPTQE